MNDEPAVYFGHLESHHVVLIGEEAQQAQYIKNKEIFYKVGSRPDETKIKEYVLVEALRAKETQGYYLASRNGINEINPIDKDLKDEMHINLLLFQNNKEKKQWMLPDWSKPQSKNNEISYQMDLSGFSYDEAFLTDETETYIALKLGEATIELFKAPYLLSPASISKLQRHQLFSHLSVWLLLTVKLNTGTILLEIWGDDGGKILYSFAGSYPNYERVMFSHWYEDVMLDICINEPPEIKGHHA